MAPPPDGEHRRAEKRLEFDGMRTNGSRSTRSSMAGQREEEPANARLRIGCRDSARKQSATSRLRHPGNSPAQCNPLRWISTIQALDDGNTQCSQCPSPTIAIESPAPCIECPVENMFLKVTLYTYLRWRGITPVRSGAATRRPSCPDISVCRQAGPAATIEERGRCRSAAAPENYHCRARSVRHRPR